METLTEQDLDWLTKAEARLIRMRKREAANTNSRFRRNKMNRPLVEATVLRLDKYGDRANGAIEKGNRIRISAFFDYEEDNHYHEFPEGSPRRVVVHALRRLADRIEKHAMKKEEL